MTAERNVPEDNTPHIATTEKSSTYWKLRNPKMGNLEIAKALGFDTMKKDLKDNKELPEYYMTHCFAGHRSSESEIIISNQYGYLREILETFADEIVWKTAERVCIRSKA